MTLIYIADRDCTDDKSGYHLLRLCGAQARADPGETSPPPDSDANLPLRRARKRFCDRSHVPAHPRQDPTSIQSSDRSGNVPQLVGRLPEVVQAERRRRFVPRRREQDLVGLLQRGRQATVQRQVGSRSERRYLSGCPDPSFNTGSSSSSFSHTERSSPGKARTWHERHASLAMFTVYTYLSASFCRCFPLLGCQSDQSLYQTPSFLMQYRTCFPSLVAAPVQE